MVDGRSALVDVQPAASSTTESHVHANVDYVVVP